MNDKDLNLHNRTYYTAPLNIEAQLLAWAYNDDTTPLGKTVFLQYTIVNKGIDTIEDVYFGIWSDPDLGDPNDDEMACDTTQNLIYVYNGRDVDAMYGVDVPALGICLLQGPVVPSRGDNAFQFMHDPIPNAKLLNMTSCSVYYGGHAIYSDPSYTNKGSKVLYGNFEGLDGQGNPTIDPTTGAMGHSA